MSYSTDSPNLQAQIAGRLIGNRTGSSIVSRQMAKGVLDPVAIKVPPRHGVPSLAVERLLRGSISAIPTKDRRWLVGPDDRGGNDRMADGDQLGCHPAGHRIVF
jgi:hypothetical protein